MNLPAVLAASCTFRLTREGREAVLARGAFRAKVTQTCIFCLDNFDAPVEEVFQARFVPVGEESEKVGSGIGRLIPFEGNVSIWGKQLPNFAWACPRPLSADAGDEDAGYRGEPEHHPFTALRRSN